MAILNLYASFNEFRRVSRTVLLVYYFNATGIMNNLPVLEKKKMNISDGHTEGYS